MFGTNTKYQPHKINITLDVEVRVNDTALYMRDASYQATFEYEGREGSIYASIPYRCTCVDLKRKDGGWDTYEISNASIVNAVLDQMRAHPPGTLAPGAGRAVVAEVVQAVTEFHGMLEEAASLPGTDEASAHVAPEPPEEPPYCDRCGCFHDPAGRCPLPIVPDDEA